MNRRLLLYMIVDLFFWAVIYYLVAGDHDRTRVYFWHYAGNGLGKIAETAGVGSFKCKYRYYQLVAP